MAKYNKDKIQECAEWVEENGLMSHGGALLKDFCAEMDITQETYYQWMKDSEFSDAIKKAKETFKESLEQRIVSSLAKTATGYEWEQKSTEFTNVDGHKVIKKQTVKTMHETPNVGAGIFLLTNINPTQWKNSQQHELTGNVSTGLKVIVENDEDKELIERLRDLK